LSNEVGESRKEWMTLLTVIAPSSRVSSWSSEDGLAPATECEGLHRRLRLYLRTNVDVCAWFDGDHLAVNLEGDIVHDFAVESAFKLVIGGNTKIALTVERHRRTSRRQSGYPSTTALLQV
jgi:hypothetical protein